MPEFFVGSPAMLLWYCAVIAAFARLGAAGLLTGSWYFSFRMPREMRARLVDPSPDAVAVNRTRYRRRWLEFGVVLVAVVPAAFLSTLGPRVDPSVSSPVLYATMGTCGAFLLWKLHRFEVAGRERWRRRLVEEGQARLDAFDDRALGARDIQ